MATRKPIRFGIVGLGGYGAKVCEGILAEAESLAPRAVLAVACEGDVDRHAQRIGQLRQRGITIADTCEDLLSEDIQAVWLPLPIDLHRQFTEDALRAGKAVLCEKPAAGAVQDVDAMIAARDLSKQICAVGYQDVYQPAAWEIKRRILRGEFGVVLSASVIGCWPRSERYYTRNDWAGRISRDGRWILDSPANNAMAHYLHLALFLLGASENASAIPREVEAELYRANPIENYDTCSLRLTFDGGAHLLAGLTHAGQTAIEPQVVIRTQIARIVYQPDRQIEIHTKFVTEKIPVVRDRFSPILVAMHKWITDGPDAARGGTLEMARAHTVTINVASQASAIIPIPPDQIDVITDAEGAKLRAIRGIESALQASIRSGRMLHETALVGWSRSAGDITLQEYNCFEGVPGSTGKGETGRQDRRA